MIIPKISWWEPFSKRKMEDKIEIIKYITYDIDSSYMTITPLLLELCANYTAFLKAVEKQHDYKFYCQFYRNDNRIKTKIHKILFDIRNKHQKTNIHLSNRINEALPFTKFRHLPKDASLPEISKPPRCTTELICLIFDKYRFN